MDKAVRIAAALTGAIKRMMAESTEDIGRHGRALEQLSQIFDKATERLEQSHESRVQTSSTPTTKANLRTAPRVHTRVTRNNTPGIIPTQTTTPIMNTEGGKEFFPQPPISEGGQNSEGGQGSVRKRPNKPRSSTKRSKVNTRIDAPVEREAQPLSARDARQEKRRKARQRPEHLVKKRARQTSHMEQQILLKTQSTRQESEPSQWDRNIIDETFQPEREKRTEIPAFRTLRVVSQEALIAFLLAAVGIERIFPEINDNQDLTTKTIEKIHAPTDLHHFCTPVIHPTTGELITSYKWRLLA